MLNTRLLLQLSQFLYFLLLMIFVVFVFIYQKSPDTQVHIYIVLLFSFLLLPIYEWIINTFIGENSLTSHFSNKANIISLGLYVATILLLLFVGKLSFLFFLLSTLVYMLYSKIDGRVFFVWALFVFLYVAFYLLFWQSELAEKLSIYAYYLLLAWVTYQIFENIIPSKLQS